MTEDATISVLRRKAGAGRPATAAAAGSISGPLRRAVARAAEDLQGLAASVSGLAESRVTLTELAEGLEEPSLLMTLSGPNDRRGLAVADLQMVAAIVEHLTTGRVVSSEAVERRPTRTDAVMIADFLDRLLAHFDTAMSNRPDKSGVSLFRCGGHLAEPRMIPLVLPDGNWTILKLTIDFGRGAKDGGLRLCFPDPPNDDDIGGSDLGDWRDSLTGTVYRSEVRLDGILHRMTVPLSAISDWLPGQLLPIPVAALSAVEVRGVDGQTVALARLGQISGNRALRLLAVDHAEQPDQSGRPAATLED